MSKKYARYTQSDITRILKAAAAAKVDVRVRITPDGSITIATGMPGETNADAVNPWDEVLHGSAEQKRPS